jgi:CBS-domain-containing membrane protein
MTKSFISATKCLQISPYLFAGIGLGCLSFLNSLPQMQIHPLFMAGFASTSLVVFFYPDTPLAAPRNVIGGHLLSAIIGLSCQTLLGNQAWWIVPVAILLSIWGMHATKTLHPPAASTPAALIMQHASWQALMTPVGIGILWLMLIGTLHKRLRHHILHSRF